MFKNSTLPPIIPIIALVFMIHYMIGICGCAPSVTRIATRPPDIIKEYKSVIVQGGKPGMKDTGVEVKIGNYVTLLAEGEINLSSTKHFPITSHNMLLFRVGIDMSAQRYTGQELITIADEGNLFLGYTTSAVDRLGEPINQDFFRNHRGYFVVTIIVWKTNDPILIANYFNPDYAIGVQVTSFVGREKRKVLSQSPRNHALRFIASDSFKIR